MEYMSIGGQIIPEICLGLHDPVVGAKWLSCTTMYRVTMAASQKVCCGTRVEDAVIMTAKQVMHCGSGVAGTLKAMKD